MRIIGLDPGLRHTGWGVVDKEGNRYTFVAAGVINPDTTLDLSQRLAILHKDLCTLFDKMRPDAAAVEETFVNKNPNSTLKLGQARGVVLCVPALYNIPVQEYTPNHIKKMVVGVGHAEKDQVALMIRKILKNVPEKIPADATDALAMALCYGFMLPVASFSRKV